MEPIISPWVLYAISALHNLDAFLGLIMGGCLMGGVYFACLGRDAENLSRKASMYTTGDMIARGACAAQERYESHKNFRRMRICCYVGLAAMVLKIFIPTQQEMYQMLAASVVTPDNLSAVKDGTLGFIREVGEAVKEAYK